MDIVFLSRTIPAQFDNEIRRIMKDTMDDAAIAWQEHIVNGLDFVNPIPIKMLNYLPVRSWPTGSSKWWIRRFEFSHCTGARDINIPFCNVFGIKRLFQGIKLYKEIKKWAKNNNPNKVIVAYSMYPEFMKAIKIAKKCNPSIKAHVIVLDLPQYCILTKKIRFVSKLYLSWSKNKAFKMLDYVDSFTFLTEEMKNVICSSKPYCVIEGVASKELKTFSKNRSDNIKYAFYGGTLHERFGIRQLLDSFKLIKLQNIKLVICGFGDAQGLIESRAKEDNRIVFLGQKSRNEMLHYLINASVIVNPRQDNEEFTKYSFPSKNLEALSSGVPLVGYKLAGIPDEYDKYINYPTNDSIESLAKLIEMVINDSKKLYEIKAIKAKQWVLENKNEKRQAQKIISLLEEK